MVKVRNLERLQEQVVELIAYADKYGVIDLNHHNSPMVGEFVRLFKKATTEPLSRQELTTLVGGVQAFVRMPVYTTNLAAAWLGIGIDTMRTVLWKSDPPQLKTMKPGHDVLIEHGELVRFSQS